MSRSFRSLSIGTPLTAALLWAGHASADPPGDNALKGMDAALNRATTQYYEYEVVNNEPGKGEKRLAIKVWIKGEKRLAEFTAPADVKGTKVLILSPTQMYVYLPAFGKVRRIASHVSDQGFMGLAFSPDDLAMQTYAPRYDARIAADSTTEMTLVATAKRGQEIPCAKVELKIAKDKSVPTETRCFNAAGQHVKTETRSAYECQKDVCTPGELKMVDHTKGGHWTKMIRKAWKVNETLSDDLFSKRSLER